jgi:hypothetical protein
MLQARSYSLAAGTPDLGADGGLEYQTNLPYFTIDPATSRKGSCYRYPRRKNPSERSTSETINGYRVVVTHRVVGTLSRQDLCAANADGLAATHLRRRPAARGDPIPNTTGNIPVTFAALSCAGTLRLTVLSDPAQVPDAEMLTAAMRQELSSTSGPAGDIDGEPPRAQNTPVCTGYLAT